MAAVYNIQNCELAVEMIRVTNFYVGRIHNTALIKVLYYYGIYVITIICAGIII